MFRPDWARRFSVCPAGPQFFLQMAQTGQFSCQKKQRGAVRVPKWVFFFKFRAQTGPHTQLKESPIILLCPTGHTHTHSCRLPKRTFQIQTETIEPVFEYLFIYFFYFKTRFLTFYFFFITAPIGALLVAYTDIDTNIYFVLPKNRFLKLCILVQEWAHLRYLFHPTHQKKRFSPPRG